jgi:hypothetical protein
MQNIYITFSPEQQHVIHIYDYATRISRAIHINHKHVFVFPIIDTLSYEAINALINDQFGQDYNCWVIESGFVHSNMGNYPGGYIEVEEHESWRSVNMSKRKLRKIAEQVQEKNVE